MSVTPEAIEAAARASAPHLWNGKLESTLLMLTGPVTFTPEQAAEAGEEKRQEQLAMAEIFLTGAAPITDAQAKAEALAGLTVESLLDTKAGLALANTAWQEGAATMLMACNDSSPGVPWEKPRSPYSAPLLRMIKDGTLEGEVLVAAMADPEGRRLADAAVALAKDTKCCAADGDTCPTCASYAAEDGEPS